MTSLKFQIRLDGDLYERESALTIAPPEGALILVAGADDGWSEEVKYVWFDLIAADVTVELQDKTDTHDEALAQTLLDAGWKRFGDTTPA